MQLAHPVTVPLALFFSSVKADFEVFKFRSGDGWGNNFDSWSIFDHVPNCDEAGDARVHSDESDVSGGRGFRCEGDGCATSDDPSNIDVMEMNFGNEDYHFTMYRDREREVVDLFGNTVARCEPYGGYDLDCNVSNVGRILGYSKLYCYSSFTAGHILEST